MKKYLVLGAMMAGLGCGGAFAGDSQAACEEFAATNGVDAAPCACIADAVAGDADLQAEQLAVVTMEDYENASHELHAAIDPCIES